MRAPTPLRLKTHYISAQDRECIRGALLLASQRSASLICPGLDPKTVALLRADAERARALYELLDGADLDVHTSAT